MWHPSVFSFQIGESKMDDIAGLAGAMGMVFPTNPILLIGKVQEVSEGV